MKKAISLIILLLFLPLGNIYAQDTPNTNFFIGAGLGFPTTQLDYSGYRSSYNFGGGITGGVSFKILPRFRFRTTIRYQRLRFDEQRFSQVANIQNSGITVDGGRESIFGLSGAFKYSFRDNTYLASPYIIGGAGAYKLAHRNINFPKNGPTTISGLNSRWAPTLKGGLGIEINGPNNLKFFGEAGITASFPEGDESVLHIPLMLGIIL